MNPQDKRWQIHRHLAQDTDERLQIVRNAPKRILLVGADADISRSLLAARYPNAVFEEYDPRADFLQTAAAARKSGFWQKLTGKTVPQHCQALTAPLPEASADMLWANLSLPRANEILPVLKNWANALKTDGLLFFTHFGRDSLTELTGRLKNARFTPVLSKADEGWQGEKGYVQTAAAKDYPDLSSYEVYACGSVAMTESAKSVLTAQCNLPETTFYSDAFSPAQ